MFGYEFDRFMFYLFVLTLVLIGAVYFIGVKTDAQTFFSGAQGLLNVATGRPTQGGAFGAYPQGAKQ